VICQILIQRGIDTFDKAKDYFRPQLSHLHNPWLMKDMQQAVLRIDAAIKNQNTNKEKVAFVIKAVQEAGGIRYATEKMLAFRDEALSILYHYPKNDVRDALEELVRFTTDRDF
jgi:geranylgeranyl pyrophosphate synthase